MRESTRMRVCVCENVCISECEHVCVHLRAYERERRKEPTVLQALILLRNIRTLWKVQELG